MLLMWSISVPVSPHVWQVWLSRLSMRVRVVVGTCLVLFHAISVRCVCLEDVGGALLLALFCPAVHACPIVS